MIQACADQDIEAHEALQEYSNAHKRIIDRCSKRMKKYGDSMVKACADQDIEAEKALENY